jgi:general secretion pathway protein A
VPRRINLLCDRALLGAYAQGRRQVDRATLDKAAAEVFDAAATARTASMPHGLGWALGAAGVLGAAVVVAMALRPPVQTPLAPAALAASAPLVVASSAAAVAAAAPVDPAAPITLALRNQRDAWRELAAVWRLDGPPQGAATEETPPCEALQRQQLRCFSSDDGLALLRLLGRPSILTLHDGSGAPSYVLLLSLDEQQATVRAGRSTQTVGLLALSRQWRGEFATLWRAPPAYEGRIISGPALAWLDERLAQVFGEQAPAKTTQADRRYDAALQARVAAFQRTQGLKSDGRAGPITLMQLNRAAGIDEPRLQTAAAPTPH